MTQQDKINPGHYKVGTPFECRLIIEAYGWDKNHSMASAFEYMCRAGHKPGEPAADDLRKAIWNLQREVGRLEKESLGKGSLDAPEPTAAVEAAAGHEGQAGTEIVPGVVAYPGTRAAVARKPTDGQFDRMTCDCLRVNSFGIFRFLVDRRNLKLGGLERMCLTKLPPKVGDFSNLPVYYWPLYKLGESPCSIRPEFVRWTTV